MRAFVLSCWLTVSLFAQSGKLGLFTHSGDVGGPAIKGSTEYDASKKQYRMTGAGANIWAKADQFQYVWQEMKGNVSVSATVRFEGEGNVHRKAGIILRQTLDTDSPYIDLVMHGNGMPAMQWRNAKGEVTNTADFPVESPGTYKLKLVRKGSAVTIFVAREGSELRELVTTQVPLTNPYLVGLGVCSHDAAKADTVVFSDVSVESLPTPPPSAKK